MKKKIFGTNSDKFFFGSLTGWEILTRVHEKTLTFKHLFQLVYFY